MCISELCISGPLHFILQDSDMQKICLRKFYSHNLALSLMSKNNLKETNCTLRDTKLNTNETQCMAVNRAQAFISYPTQSSVALTSCDLKTFVLCLTRSLLLRITCTPFHLPTAQQTGLLRIFFEIFCDHNSSLNSLNSFAPPFMAHYSSAWSFIIDFFPKLTDKNL